MKKEIKFKPGWNRFVCEVCKESYPVEMMHITQGGEYFGEDRESKLVRIVILCEECNTLPFF